MARPQTHLMRCFEPQLAGPFISSVCVFYLLFSSLHQRYSLKPDTVKLDPIRPGAPGCQRKTKYQQIPGAHIIGRRYVNPSQTSDYFCFVVRPLCFQVHVQSVGPKGKVFHFQVCIIPECFQEAESGKMGAEFHKCTGWTMHTWSF